MNYVIECGVTWMPPFTPPTTESMGAMSTRTVLSSILNPKFGAGRACNQAPASLLLNASSLARNLACGALIVKAWAVAQTLEQSHIFWQWATGSGGGGLSGPQAEWNICYPAYDGSQQVIIGSELM